MTDFLFPHYYHEFGNIKQNQSMDPIRRFYVNSGQNPYVVYIRKMYFLILLNF